MFNMTNLRWNCILCVHPPFHLKITFHFVLYSESTYNMVYHFKTSPSIVTFVLYSVDWWGIHRYDAARYVENHAKDAFPCRQDPDRAQLSRPIKSNAGRRETRELLALGGLAHILICVCIFSFFLFLYVLILEKPSRKFYDFIRLSYIISKY